MKSKSLSRLLQAKDQLLAIGAHDGLSGRLGERAGFDALWASGFEISASHGLPDANLLDLSAHLAAACQINEATALPPLVRPRGPVGKWAAQNLTIQALALKLPAHPADPDFDETISSRGYC